MSNARQNGLLVLNRISFFQWISCIARTSSFFRIGEHVHTSTQNSVISKLLNPIDMFFYERGLSRPVLDVEICIDIDYTTLVSCRQPNYRFREQKIMNQHITTLEDSG